MVSDFAGNSGALKLKKVQTKLENITGVHYSSRGSTGSGVKFVLSFSLFYICAKSQILPLSIVATSHFCCHGPPLKYCVQYYGRDTIAATNIQRLICWTGRLFVGRSFA